MLLDALAVGRESGAQDAVSAERIARKLQSEDATAIMPSAERPRARTPQTPGPAAARTAVAPPTAPAAVPAVRSSGSRLTVFLLVLLLGALAATWLLYGRAPLLIVENRLVEPIRVTVGAAIFEVPAGGRAEQRVRRRGPLVAQWYLVRPTGPGGAPLGIELQGSLTEPKPSGRILRTVDAGSTADPVFAPLITNATDGPVSIIINAGTVNAQPCNCRVNPGASRARIGYYPLYLNSAVQAATAAGGTATFKQLGVEVDRQTGAVGLRFEQKDFQR